ncbi:F-box protein CPR1 [Lactuca sativa]|uniref:F-box protein CPR1 n=1 Tax=Lactuca sativa TaxID=4236 RepID=UPI000CC25C67|nr:F-box protein CPR1 [Lactuca sativa]
MKRSVELPSELVVCILSRLPSKSLLRCRSVCKSWLSFISSSHFKVSHLDKFNQLNSRYLVRRFILHESKEEYTVHFDDQNFTLDTNSPIQSPFNFYLSGTEVLSFKIIGCCNGVIFFSTDTIGRDEIILWNPSIRKKLTLIPPMFPRSELLDLDIYFCFGYLALSDDYIVLRIAKDRGLSSITTTHVQIYTVKTAIWRELVFPKDLSSSIVSSISQVFVNGSVHWVACEDIYSATPLSILTFDMSTELFGKIHLPDFLVHLDLFQMKLAVVLDSLAVIYCCRYSAPWNTSCAYEIWAMKEYKKPSSWTMLCKVSFPNNDVGSPLGLTNNGNLITVGSKEGDVMICNWKRSYTLYGPCSKDDDSKYTFVERYNESLALLDHGELDDENEVDLSMP